MTPESMDPFEEFQFKPITEGLGFHRKVKSSSTSPLTEDSNSQEPTLTSTQFRARGLDLLESEKPLEFKSPLPRQESNLGENAKNEELSPSSAAVDEILSKLGSQRGAEFKSTPNKSVVGTQKNTEISHKLVMDSVSISAGILDLMLIIAGSLLGFIVLLTVTEIDLLANLSHPQDYGLYLATGSLFFGVSIVYYLGTRMIMGCSAGEWAYDQQLGTENDQKDFMYGPLIVVRTCLNLLTGIFILPLISFILKKDIVGSWIGLEIYKKRA